MFFHSSASASTMEDAPPADPSNGLTVTFTEPGSPRSRMNTARSVNTTRTNTAKSNLKTPRKSGEGESPSPRKDNVKEEDDRPPSVQKYSPLPPITPTKELSPAKD